MGIARRAGALAVIGAALATGAVHCSLTTSLDGFSSGLGAGDDASVPETGAGVTDATPDVAPDADASDTRRWCDRLSPAAMFCDDFDDSVSPRAWDVTRVDPGTTLTRVTTDARSPPRSLLITTTGTAKQDSLLEKELPLALVKKIHLGYDMKVDQFGDYLELAYIKVFADQKNSALLVRLHHPDGVAGLTAQSYSTTSSPTINANAVLSSVFAKWTRIDLDFDLAALSAKMSVDGAQVASVALDADKYVSGTASVGLGVEYVPLDNTPWRVRFDNVTIDWE